MNVFGKVLILKALEALGREVHVSGDTELLIIGGAAGLLTGQFSDSWEAKA